MASTMGGSSASEHGTALATTSSSTFLSARSESMMESTESEKRTSLEEQIERSKSHWSQVVESDSIPDAEEVADNVAVFRTLQLHPTWGSFFRTFGYDTEVYLSTGDLVVGEKFAEGGQAELYHAQVKWWNPTWNKRDLEHGYQWVLKVFKKGTLLRHLQSQWPQVYLQFHAEELENWESATPKRFRRYFCDVHHGTLLKDGRFAFLMISEREDLIDRGMTLRSNQDQGPFPKGLAEVVMYDVAKGMDWLHTEGPFDCSVADFECSIGVVGTGFFRAPEILQACKDKYVNQRLFSEELFSKESDVYSFGVTCYEILTGKLPFEGHSKIDYDLVLKGQRPMVPEYVDDWLRELLRRCWQSNPPDRPAFGEILNILNILNILRQIHKQSEKDKEKLQKN